MVYLCTCEWLARYSFGAELGRGAFATVFDATRKQPADASERVAIKVIDKALCGSLAEVEAEIAIMAMLRHAHVLKLHESFDTRKRMYLVMELATGGELFERLITYGVYTEADAARLFRQLCDALKYLARLGVTHGDLKPENLLFATPAPDAPLKIADFGLASVILGPTTHAATALCGTPSYVAPEILMALPRAYSPPVDMWAAGAILHVMLSCELPFGSAGELGLEKLYAHITAGDYERCQGSAWATVSGRAKDLVQKLLEVDRVERLTALGALVHPWVHFAGGGSDASLAAAQGALRKQLAHERLKAAINKVKATTRMQHAERWLQIQQAAGRTRPAAPP